jgi:hypothetical protein
VESSIHRSFERFTIAAGFAYVCRQLRRIPLKKLSSSAAIGAIIGASLAQTSPARASHTSELQLPSSVVFNENSLAASYTDIRDTTGERIDLVATERITNKVWVNSLRRLCPGCSLTWSGFRPLDGIFFTSTAGLGLASLTHGDVFGVGTDQHVYLNRRVHSTDSYVGWEDWGAPAAGVCSSPSATASFGFAVRHVFVKGCDNRLYHNWENAGGWEDLGGDISTAPYIVPYAGDSFFDVFAGTTWGGIWRDRYDAVNNPTWVWSSTGLPVSGNPVAGVENAFWSTPFTRVSGQFVNEFRSVTQLVSKPPLPVQGPYTGWAGGEVFQTGQLHTAAYGSGTINGGSTWITYIGTNKNLKAVKWSTPCPNTAPCSTPGTFSFPMESMGVREFVGEPAAAPGCGLTNGTCQHGAHLFAANSSGKIFHHFVW